MLIILMLIGFIVLSFNCAFATNETDSFDTEVLSLNEDVQSEILSVDDSSSNELNVIENHNNLSEVTSKTIEITQDNYESYFDIRTGKILSGADISKGDTLKIGNISSRAFVIDRQLTLMPITSNDKITNGFIHLIKGSDGSTITNLTINNTEATLSIRGVTVGQLHGIWLSNSNNNLISYNTIRIANSGGVYALPMGWSSNNRIIYNDMKTYISSTVIMGDSHYNLISHNSLEVLSYSDLSVTNLIYFNPFGHADYYGSPLCKGNIISYNYLKGFCTLPMSIILQFEYANHEGTVVANNTIIKGSYGVNLNGNNVSVYGNVIQNSATCISVSGSDITIRDNIVGGDSQSIGIMATGEYGTQCDVFNNNITYSDVSTAMNIGDNVNAYNNNINIKNYGVGISITGANSTVHDNTIRNNHDYGISLLGNYAVVDNNIINTNSIGVAIPASSTGLRYYNNSIINNKITSESHGISIDGLVYNSIITDNVIETNSTVGINIQITDAESNTQLDNMVNGVILNSTALVINDDNFYQYFDKNGYLTYQFDENKNKLLLFTFLTNKNIHFTDKINVISNKMNNLLFNVTVSFEGDAAGSLIRDLQFINYDKEAIIVDGVDDVSVTNNNITEIFKKGSLSNSAILMQDVCNAIVLSNNNIYVNSKIDYVYGINIPSINFANKRLNKKLSSGFSVANNNIIMISDGVCEAIYSDSISDSDFKDNKINIISKGYAYGIAFANVIGKLSGINITGNEIVIHTDKMAYLIELYMIDNSTIANNSLYGECNGIYGVAVYRSDNISILSNYITIHGGDLDKIKTIEDTLGIGNSAIAVIKDTNHVLINDNMIYANTTNPISLINITDLENVSVLSNSYIVDDNNYVSYFANGKLRNGVVEENSSLLLHNITGEKVMEITIPIVVSSYDQSIPASVTLNLNKIDGVVITNITFINSTINLKDSSNNIISKNIFNSTKSTLITVRGGKNNTFEDNVVYMNSKDISGISLTKTQSNEIKNNMFEINGSDVKVIVNEDSNYNIIDNNTMKSLSDSLIFIYSHNSMYDNITNNQIAGNASSVFGYYGSKANYGFIGHNNMEIKGVSDITEQSGIYYTDMSLRNNVVDNRIVSFSKNADDYAITVISARNLFNSFVENFLLSSNGSKRANDAIYAPFDSIDKNTPIDIYVSINGSDITGDGSEYRPYASISKAIANALNHAVIYVDGGYFNESGINIDKNISIVVINPGNAVIDADAKQLFNIAKNGILTISGITIKNAYNQDGGSAFINNGKLYIYDSVICNSSSFYDNSDPVFDRNATYDRDGELESGHSYDCSDTGKGGAILNNGELTINSSVFYNNFAHIGGVIADYGIVNINSSLFYNNKAVHGGVIFTDSQSKMTIDNSLFKNNTALITLDYCPVRKVASSWSISSGIGYTYHSDCDYPVGEGGVIYSKNTSLDIANSSFIDNAAKSGGVFATKVDSFSSSSSFKSNVDLEIDNCYFMNNRANRTKLSNSSNDLTHYSYNSGFNGGVVSGTFNKLYINQSEFYYNQAMSNGGVLYAKANDGQIIDSIFEQNTAGTSGGALDLSKNFIIMRSIISNNSARYGGAIEYDSYTYYGHIQDNLNIYNSTISHNRALNSGGAFDVASGNITVHNSNIVDNSAPSSSTINSRGGTHAIDMRYNYWGTSASGSTTPDDSVWKVSGLDFRPWSRQWINWEPEKVVINPTDPVNVDPDKPNQNNNNNPGNGQSSSSKPISTGTSTSTGTSIGGNGAGRGNANSGTYSGNGDGNNLGPGGNGIGGSFASLPGFNGYSGQSVTGNANSSSNAYSQVSGTVDANSLSKSNSSNYDSNLVSVGMVANAAASSSSYEGSDGESGASSSSGGASVSKSYEITEKLDELMDDEQSMISFIAIAVIVLSLLVIGYKRKEHENED